MTRDQFAMYFGQRASRHDLAAGPEFRTRFSSRPILFAFSVLLRLSQADPGATPVLIDEFDTARF